MKIISQIRITSLQVFLALLRKYFSSRLNVAKCASKAREMQILKIITSTEILLQDVEIPRVTTYLSFVRLRLNISTILIQNCSREARYASLKFCTMAYILYCGSTRWLLTADILKYCPGSSYFITPSHGSGENWHTRNRRLSSDGLSCQRQNSLIPKIFRHRSRISHFIRQRRTTIRSKVEQSFSRGDLQIYDRIDRSKSKIDFEYLKQKREGFQIFHGFQLIEI